MAICQPGNNAAILTCCNLRPSPSAAPEGEALVFQSNSTANSSSGCGPVLFGQCCELTQQTPGQAVEITAQTVGAVGDRAFERVHVFSDAARNYVVAYSTIAGGVSLIAPSAQFEEKLPRQWNRFVWANLCSACGDVSAYVNSYAKQINADGKPMSCCGRAVDETEGFPGPPEGAAGVFTAFSTASHQLGSVVANITFPWNLTEYDGRESFQVLLAPGLTASVLVGQQPRIFHGGRDMNQQEPEDWPLSI